MKEFIRQANSFMNRCNVKKFADDTAMHGFKELYYSKRLFWTTVWHVVMVLAMVVTLFQVSKSIIQFRNQPTVTTVQPLEDGKLVYSSLSLCYEHWSSWVDFRKVSNLNMSKPALLYGLAFFDKIFSQETFDLDKAQNQFQAIMNENKWTNLFQFYESIAENLPRHLVYNELNDLKNSFFTKEVPLSGDLCYTVAGRNISAIDKKGSLSMRKSASKMISFQIRKNVYLIFDEYLTADEFEAYYLRNIFSINDITFKDEKHELRSLSVPVILSVTPDSDIVLNPDIDKYVIKLRANVHKFQNQNKSPCLEDVKTISSNYSCLIDCYALLYKKCEAVFFLFAEKLGIDSLTKMCRRNIVFKEPNGFFNNKTTFEQELSENCKCNDSNDDEQSIFIECLKRCKVGCEKWDFDVTVTFSSDSSKAKQVFERKYTTIEIYYPAEQAILVVSEMNSQSWETFVANVGGLLGIWLGASIVTFFQTVYLCCCSADHEEQTVKVVKSRL